MTRLAKFISFIFLIGNINDASHSDAKHAGKSDCFYFFQVGVSIVNETLWDYARKVIGNIAYHT